MLIVKQWALRLKKHFKIGNENEFFLKKQNSRINAIMSKWRHKKKS